MENVKRDTNDLYPFFWEDFENNSVNREIRNNLVKQLLMKTDIDTNKFNVKLGLANFCDVLIFLLKKVEIVYNEKLNNYLDILSIMCIYSSLIRELNVFERDILNQSKSRENLSINLVEEFINLFNNFEYVLENIGNESVEYTYREKDMDISNDIKLSINKTRDLYLRVSQCI